MRLSQPVKEPRPRRARTLARIVPLFLFLLCLPSVFASASYSFVTTPTGATVLSNNLVETLPPYSPPGTVGSWEITGPLDVTATGEAVTVTYDYNNASAGSMAAGAPYTLFLSVDDSFWSADSNIFLQSLTVTSTISRCFANNAQPCPNNPDPNAFFWSVSTSYTLPASMALGTSSAPLHVTGSANAGAEIPITDTFAIELTSTMVFSRVTAGDVIHIDLPDTTQDELTPEPATLSLAGLAIGACVFLKRRRASGAVPQA